MPRISTKENKNIYQTTREELVLSREAASELMETISPERLVRIEGDSYVFREIFLLGLETVLLGILHGGYSGISGNPFCGRRLFRGDCPGRELNPCNSCRPQCCSPPVRQLVHGIFLQRHGVKFVNHLLQ